MPSISKTIATELGVGESQVVAAVKLLDEGATVPFVARYRKEATGGLDDAQLRTLEERLRYLRELEERRTAIRAAIEEQGKLTPELAAAIATADTKARLEDLYLPYKTKRRTKAMIAREAGLGPLAEALLAHRERKPEDQAAAFVDEGKGVADVKAALEGARHILVERFAEDADLIGRLREDFWKAGRLVSTVREGRSRRAPSSRTISPIPASSRTSRPIAFSRSSARKYGGALRLRSRDPPRSRAGTTRQRRLSAKIAANTGLGSQPPGERWLRAASGFAWRTRCSLSIELDARARLWGHQGGARRIKTFRANLPTC